MIERVQVRVSLSLMTGCIVAVILYAALRTFQYATMREPNPAMIIWSAHAGFFWRTWTVVYLAGMAAFLAYLASARDAARLARLLSAAVWVAAAAIAIQGIFVP